MRIKQRAHRLSIILLPLWFLLIGSYSAVFSQNLTDITNQWFNQAQATTDEIIKGASNLKSYNRALIWARLGDVWWQTDQERARKFFLKAVEDAETKPEQEKATVSDQAAAIRKLLTVIGARDSRLNDRLMTLLKTDADEATKSGNKQTAEALLEAALAVLKENPQKAAALGMASLRQGDSYLIQPLLFRLRARDQTLADELFSEAVATERETASSELLTSLINIAFPEVVFPTTKLPAPPDQLRAALLAVIAERLLRAPTSPENEAEICKLASSTVWLISKFDSLLPQQSSQIRYRMSACQSVVSAESRRYIESSLRGESSNRTVDDYLNAADKAADIQTRFYYLLRAIELEKQQGRVERAIALLDSMCNDERKYAGELWDNLHWNLAVTAAYNYVKRENYADMQRTLAAVPTKTRPFAQIMLAGELRNFKDKNIVLELIKDARSGLSKNEISDSDRIAAYFWWRGQGLIDLYAAFAPEQVFEVFSEAVKALNAATSPSLPEEAASGGKSDNESLLPINIPKALLGTDAISARQAISVVEDANIRARLQFGLLRSLLQQYKSAQASERARKKSIG